MLKKHLKKSVAAAPAWVLASVAAAALLVACGGGGDGGSKPVDSNKNFKTDAAGNVTLQFGAYSGDKPMECGQRAKVKGMDMEIEDFRFYVSNVQLVKADGSKVALKLSANDDYNYTTEDGKDNVSLIDLRQPKGYCSSKAAYHPTIKGTVTPGEYVGAEVTLGVPLALNHLNPNNDTTTPAVLRSSVHPAMSWAWRAGRKFTGIEMNLPLGFKKNSDGKYVNAAGEIIAEAASDAYGRVYDAKGNIVSGGKILNASTGTAIGDATVVDAKGQPIPGPIVKNSDDKGVVYGFDNKPIEGAKVLDDKGAAVTKETRNNRGVLQKQESDGTWVTAVGWKVVNSAGVALQMASASPVNLDKWTLLHLGSTGCPAQNSKAGTPGAPAPGECKAPNRLPMTFAQFNPATQAIAVDVQALFADDDLTAMNGCMSGITHAVCAGPFKALALDWKADGSGNGLPIAGQTQTVFKVIRK